MTAFHSRSTASDSSRIIGSVISAASQNIAMLIVGRIINGFCVGICSSQVPVYISELSPPRLRGRLVGCQQWAITWGIGAMKLILGKQKPGS